ncbi:radical SAM protein [Pandoraea communis]|uniref:radical SAM protein n=1 Tax=Pandoraea communis TaxID=2508297 RepID=UPI0025A521E7|nr:radical SAM protein [Pandoraea communis]MDM8354844.1 radical SAM protein [Pandoraea communis]
MLPLPIPQTISLSITTDCSSRCPHCYLVETDQLGRHRLSKETVVALLDDGVENGTCLVIVSGGDPLLHPDIESILCSIRSRRMLPLLGISGNQLSADHLSLLVTLGIPCVQVSLDAANAPFHDRRRGEGHFDAVHENVRRLQERGILVNLALCLSMENRRELIPLLAHAHKHKFYNIKLSFYEQVGPVAGAEVISEVIRRALLEQAWSFAQAHGMGERITAPGYSLATAAALPQASRGRPPIVVMADGALRSGEDGPCFGHIKNTLPMSRQYTAWLRSEIEQLLRTLVRQRCDAHGVYEVRRVCGALPCNGLVFVESKNAVIVIRDDLPWPLDQFTVLHELGHLATSTLRENVLNSYDPRIETLANLWALDVLRPYIRSDEFAYYLRDAAASQADR